MHTGRSGWRKRDADSSQRKLPRIPWMSHARSAPGHKYMGIPRLHNSCVLFILQVCLREEVSSLFIVLGPASCSQSPLTPKRVTTRKPQHLQGLASEVTGHPPTTFIRQQRVTKSSQLWRGRELSFLSLSRKEEELRIFRPFFRPRQRPTFF